MKKQIKVLWFTREEYLDDNFDKGEIQNFGGLITGDIKTENISFFPECYTWYE